MINLELQRRIEGAKRRVNGHWMSMLERLGVDRKVLSQRNQPCPGCGGKDRFQFTDKYGDGNYICRGCGPGDGFALLELCLGWKFSDALKAMGWTPPPATASMCQSGSVIDHLNRGVAAANERNGHDEVGFAVVSSMSTQALA